ncbi:hypothetical protein PILCRDRAFT_827113 [Piloderma croceum F 1598]|uniref:Uncharacterized protein n=1 Tax=Piloderma croceum (strain F 1598) TaxID=765440 RepID=A0A0C3F6I5_PILCF|nr:hypothetical protein PILCRDRAFT_827113 [Piloderma croceum F 1598]
MSQPASRAQSQAPSVASDHEDGQPQTEPSQYPRRQSRNRRRRQRNPSISEEEDERPQRRSTQNQGGLPGVDQVEDTTRALTNTAGGVVGNVGNTAGQLTGGEKQKEEGSGSDKPLKLRLDVNLDVEITLEARVHGDLTLALLR